MSSTSVPSVPTATIMFAENRLPVIGTTARRPTADRRVALTGGLPGTHADLVAEQQQRPLAAGTSVDPGVLLLKPRPGPVRDPAQASAALASWPGAENQRTPHRRR